MVLELKVPHGEKLDALVRLIPVFLSYVLSFVYVGIYWNNHHHMLHAGHKVTGPMLWANLHLLFWMLLFPFATGWMGANHFAAAPSAVYGGVLLMAAVAYWILQQLTTASRRARLPLKEGGRKGLEGKGITPHLPDCHPCGVLVAMDLPGSLRAGCPGVACAGSTHRARAVQYRAIAHTRRGDRPAAGFNESRCSAACAGLLSFPCMPRSPLVRGVGEFRAQSPPSKR